jgi:uncharacterized protein (TIRG00374 family)
LTISLALGGVVSALALYLAFRNVPFADLVQYLASIDLVWMLPAVALVVVCFLLRGLRWQMIVGSTVKIGFWNAFHPMMIGFMINCILPGRVGEVARPVILQKNEKVPFTTGLATVAAERVFDLMMLVGLFVVLIATIQIDPEINYTVGSQQLNRETLETVFKSMITLGLVLIAGIIFVSIQKTRSLIVGCIRLLPSLVFFGSPAAKTKIDQRICEPLIRIVENIAKGFELIKYPKKIFVCLFYSWLIWSLQAASYYLVTLGCPGIDLTLAELYTVMVIVSFFIALPAVPGFWGLWEAGGVFAMSLFGVAAKEAAGYTLLNHAVQMFPVIFMGFISAVISSINIWQISYHQKQT